jgi:GWxTD domain-containing protein
MNNSFFTFLLFLFLSISGMLSAQKMYKSENIFHLKGVEAFTEGRIDEAEKLFKTSISEFDYAPSYFQLGKLYKSKGTVRANIQARKYFENAILRDKNNIAYRKELALIIENFSKSMAYDVYKNILKLDKNNVDALYNLGKIKEDDFYEYINSFIKDDDSPALSYSGFALDDFDEAVKYYLVAIKIDPKFIDSYTHLALLYIELNKPKRAITYLNSSIKNKPDNKETLLLLGICYYKLSNLDSSYLNFNKALNLMDESEKSVYTSLSVKYFLNPDDFKNSDSTSVIKKYWQSKDPLYLTSYNERLLEHYVRVAYSNFNFSVKKLELPGWETDRGEVLIRYGIPQTKFRFRPQISAGGNTSLLLKTDTWVYEDKVFGFTDDYWTGDFRFSAPNPSGRHHSQFGGDSETFIQDERRNEPESYTPKFNGPVIEVPYVISEFKNLKNESSDEVEMVVSFATKSDNHINNDFFSANGFKTGVFILNKDYEIINRKVKNLKRFSSGSKLNLGLDQDFNINTIEISAKPDSVNFAFEVVRNLDNAVSTNHKAIAIKNILDDKIEMSDILLCEKVSKTESNLPLQRGDYYLLPNPLNTFVSTNDIYLYYEVYNLNLNKSNVSNFEQELKIEQIDETTGAQKIINSVLNTIGLSPDEEQLVVKTNYSNFGRTAQVYLQLNMDNYKKGRYNILLNLTDKQTGEKISSRNELIWK